MSRVSIPVLSDLICLPFCLIFEKISLIVISTDNNGIIITLSIMIIKTMISVALENTSRSCESKSRDMRRG